jgi:hypothetical protein
MSSPEPETPNPFGMSMQQQEMDPINRALEPLVQAGRNEPMVVGPMIARQLRGFVPIAEARERMQIKNSLNPYAYVNNNPIRYTDPSGLCISGTQPDDDGAFEYCEKICKKWEKDALQWILCMERCMAGK